ncbi:MAG: hypothetical protein WCJ64_17590, partial [Rhodospirillaceae bacterium]
FNFYSKRGEDQRYYAYFPYEAVPFHSADTEEGLIAEMKRHAASHLVACIVEGRRIPKSWVETADKVKYAEYGHIQIGITTPIPRRDGKQYYDAVSAEVNSVGFENESDREDILSFMMLSGNGNLADALCYWGCQYYDYLEILNKNLDYGKAAKWFKLAADLGSPGAIFALGSMHMDGKGMEQSPTKALALWDTLSDFAFAHYAIGLAYLDGIGVPVNKTEAARRFRLAAAEIVDAGIRVFSLLHDKQIEECFDGELRFWAKQAALHLDERALTYFDQGLKALYRKGLALARQNPEGQSPQSKVWREVQLANIRPSELSDDDFLFYMKVLERLGLCNTKKVSEGAVFIDAGRDY